MKTCVQCGCELPDSAGVCTVCGAQQPAKKKTRHLRTLYIVSVVLAVLVAAGMFANRYLKHPAESRHYDMDGNLEAVVYYDGRGVVTKEVEYDADGSVRGVTEYRDTDTCWYVDAEEVEAMDGVRTVAIRQMFAARGEADPEETLYYMVLGYDWRGRLVGWQIFEHDEDELDLYRTSESTLDAYGYPTQQVLTMEASGATEARTFENHYLGLRLVSSDVRSVSRTGSHTSRVEYLY